MDCLEGFGMNNTGPLVAGKVIGYFLLSSIMYELLLLFYNNKFLPNYTFSSEN